MPADDILTAKLIHENLEWQRRKIEEAEYALRQAKSTYKVNRKRRDKIIVEQVQAGMSCREVARRIGMPNPTVASIYQAGKPQ